MLSIRLGAIKPFNHGKWNNDIAHVLNLPAFTVHTISTQRKRISKAAKVTIDSASSEVVSFSGQPVMDERKGLLLDGCNKVWYSAVILYVGRS